MSDIPFHENIDWEEQERIAEFQEYICPYCNYRGNCENHYDAECQFDGMQPDEVRHILVDKIMSGANGWSSDRVYALKKELYLLTLHLQEKEKGTKDLTLLQEACGLLHYIAVDLFEEEENIDENNNEGEDRG